MSGIHVWAWIDVHLIMLVVANGVVNGLVGKEK